MLNDNFHNLFPLIGDTPLKVAMLYPIIGFCFFNPIFSLLPVAGNAIALKVSGLKAELYNLWVLRFLLLAILFPVLYDKIQKIIKIKNKNLHRFVSIIVSFGIIWLIFFPFFCIFRSGGCVENPLPSFVFIPLIVSALLFVQLKVSEKLQT